MLETQKLQQLKYVQDFKLYRIAHGIASERSVWSYKKFPCRTVLRARHGSIYNDK